MNKFSFIHSFFLSWKIIFKLVVLICIFSNVFFYWKILPRNIWKKLVKHYRLQCYNNMLICCFWIIFSQKWITNNFDSRQQQTKQRLVEQNEVKKRATCDTSYNDEQCWNRNIVPHENEWSSQFVQVNFMIIWVALHI